MVQNCIVNGCKQEAYPGSKYTFHRMPKSEEVRRQWMRAIRKNFSKYSVVCSLHFKPEDYATQARKRLKPDAVPSILLAVSPNDSMADFDIFEDDCGETTVVEFISEELSACRACLATGAKLYSIADGLEEMYKEVMGVEYSEDDVFPQHLCACCRALLLKSAALRSRCRRSQELLKDILKHQPYLSTDDVKIIDRKSHNLTLNLAKLKIDTFNLTDNDVSGKNNEKNYQVINDNFEDTFNYTEYLEINEVNDTLIEYDNKIEADKPKLFLEVDGVKGRVKVKENTENDEETQKVKTKKIDKTNSVRFVAGKKNTAAALLKYQLRLGRAENDFLSNFDHAEFEEKYNCKLKILTMEEQLEEIAERKQSSDYLDSDYKCEYCGRGFEFEQTFQKHMAKHDPNIGKYKCEVCHAFFQTQSLKYHHLDCHKMKFTCNVCSFVTRARHQARRHYLMHTGKAIECNLCDATFTVPLNEELKRKWVRAIPGNISKSSVVCSAHFKEEDFVIGLRRRLKPGAVPSILPEGAADNTMNDSFDETNEATAVEFVTEELSACRACLATGAKLYSIAEGLGEALVQIMGVEYSEDDVFPQHLCACCRALLLKSAALRSRCRRSQELLKQLLEDQPYLSTDDILTIDRKTHNLTLNLAPLTAYTFNSVTNHEPQQNKDENIDETFDDTFNDREYLEIRDDDPLVGDEIKIEEDKPKLFFEVDGVKGEVKVKEVTVDVKEKLKEKSKKDKKDVKTKRISNLLRFVAGKKRNAKPLTKYQLQLRRAENNFLPNFDHAEFEAKYNCKLKILTMEEQLGEIAERKLSSNYLNLDYKCEYCGRGFEFEQPFQNHMAKHDPNIGKFVCEVCHIYFRTQYLRHRHLDYHKMKFTCNICSFVTRARHQARSHYLMHTGKVFKCKQCDATFTKSTSYFGHVRLNHPSKDAVCEICGDSFIGPMGLRHHKAKAHRQLPKPKYECGTCGVQFSSMDAVSRHTDGRDACDASMKPCTECGEEFATEESLRRHADETHPRGNYWCVECSQSFLSESSLDTHHQRVHLKIKWPAYGRTREMNKEYYKKVKERTRQKAQVVCEMCGARLTSNAALERHQQGQCKRERNSKAYKCPYCDKTCATRQGLQLHITLHTGEKPYKCAQCPLEFRQAGPLKRHLKGVHLGIDTRVQCEFCAKYFSTPTTRKLHVNTVHLHMPHPPRRRANRCEQ